MDYSKLCLIAYEKGLYRDAIIYFSKAVKENDLRMANIYADICFRDLDNKHRPLEECAKWYIIAADNGDGDILSFLNSLHPDLIYENIHIIDRIKILVEKLRTIN